MIASKSTARCTRDILSHSHQPSLTLPVALSRAASTACAIATAFALGCAPPATAMLGPADQDPYVLADKIQYGPVNGAMRACPSNINPNCISTASTNETYGPAWRAAEADPVQAAKSLEAAIYALFPPGDARLLQSETLEGLGEYRVFGFTSSFGTDVTEFLIKPERVREGAPPEGALVTYRSLAGSVKYIWPIQQPIGDFDAQRKRTVSIRDALGWRVIGCDLLECYQ